MDRPAPTERSGCAHTSSVEHELIAPGDDDDDHLLQLLLQTQRQLSFRSAIEPPTVKRTPWRTPIGRGCEFRIYLALLVQKLGKGSHEPHVAGNLLLRREQQPLFAFDQPGIKVAAVNNTTTMRGAIVHLKNAKVTGYQTYDEIFGLLKGGEIDAFALSRDQLNAMAKQIPGTRVLDETFKQTVTAVAVPPNRPQSLAFAVKFLNEAIANGTLRKAYDNNGLKDRPVRTQTQ